MPGKGDQLQRHHAGEHDKQQFHTALGTQRFLHIPITATDGRDIHRMSLHPINRQDRRAPGAAP